MTNAKIKRDDPDLLKYFGAHCRSGYSPRSFSGYLYQSQYDFTWLLKNNPEFKAINEQYKNKVKRIGFFNNLVN